MEKEKICVKIDSKLIDLEGNWTSESRMDGEDIIYYLHGEGGHRISVLNRQTGFIDGRRDIETGYTSPDNKFWLASGNFDIRIYHGLTFQEAIEKIKKHANTCIGV